MASIRSFLVASAALPLILTAACGGGGGGGDVDGGVTPTGMHYTSVVDKAFVPTNNNQARDYGLDLGAPKSNVPDQIIDNQLGMVLGTLSTMGFDVQGAIDTAVAKGSIILLVDYQTPDFTTSPASGVQVKLGANPMPAPCTDDTDTVCGHHLQGTGTFTVAPNSPNNAALAGKVAGGVFNGGPGDVTLQIALGGTNPITLSLHVARAKISGATETGVDTMIVGGALTQTDLNTVVLPAIQAQLPALIARDCNMLTSPPGCGCTAGSTGRTLLDLFDGDIQGSQKDCAVSVEEIQANTLIKSLLAPDVCSMATCTAPDALSLGIKVHTVKATVN